MISKLTNFIFECCFLKKVEHVGIKRAGIENPDSVAEHSLNAAQIGYILAKMEGADANKVATMLVWHDIAETRIGDMDKVMIRYITNKKEIEKKVMQDQFNGFSFADELHNYFDEYEDRLTLEGKIAKDADYLEQAFQSKIYKETGYELAQNWIDHVGAALKTESAKKIWKEAIKTSFTDRRHKTGLKDLSNV